MTAATPPGAPAQYFQALHGLQEDIMAPAIRFTVEVGDAAPGEKYVDVHCDGRHLNFLEMPNAAAKEFEAMVTHWPDVVEALDGLIERQASLQVRINADRQTDRARGWAADIRKARTILAAIRGETATPSAEGG